MLGDGSEKQSESGSGSGKSESGSGSGKSESGSGSGKSENARGSLSGACEQRDTRHSLSGYFLLSLLTAHYSPLTNENSLLPTHP